MVSVVIPMYNSAGTIERALKSVCDQYYKGQIEIIVVNDGSTDNSQNVVENFIHDHPNNDVKLINQENGGVSKARNTGLRNAKGDYIALLDSDDAWNLNKIERQIFIMETYNFDFICGLRNNENVKFPYRVKNGVSIMTLRKLMIRIVGQTSTSIFKRKILDNTGFFDEQQKFSEDANFWMRISLNNRMGILNEQLATTDNDYGQSGLSSNMNEMEKGVHKNINEMFYKKKINFIEFLFFKSFAKFKYMVRMLKVKK